MAEAAVSLVAGGEVFCLTVFICALRWCAAVIRRSTWCGDGIAKGDLMVLRSEGRAKRYQERASEQWGGGGMVDCMRNSA